MHPRLRIGLVWGGLALLVLLAFSLGRARRSPELRDRRPSTFLSGPEGARGLADALERLDVRVVRWRGRLRDFTAAAPPDEPQALVLLDPGRGLEDGEVAAIARWHAAGQGGLFLAGPGAETLMHCFGWTIGDQAFASSTVRPPGQESDQPARVSRFLMSDSRVAEDALSNRLCDLAPVRSVDTLLVADDGGVAAVGISLAGDIGPVTLLSDADLVRNRTLRDTDAGPLLLGLFAGDYGVVVFEEGSHGFGSTGSLAGAVLAWSRRSPWGWATWQLALVGLLALLAGAVRFGPVRSVLERRRRSPLEHVSALATALSAARGHDVAIGALVRGLRRRLAPHTPPAADPGPWLRDLAARAPSRAARDRALTLLEWTRPGQPAAVVRSAAITVEDLWEDLRR